MEGLTAGSWACFLHVWGGDHEASPSDGNWFGFEDQPPPNIKAHDTEGGRDERLGGCESLHW